MNNNCVFTIVAKNYIGLAKILGESIQKYSNDVDFYIVVADEVNNTQDEMPSNAIVAKNNLDITTSKWTEMSFKYDLTELCTSIKPFCFKFFFNKGYDSVIYFDPDIFVFSSLNVVFDGLKGKSVMLVPHIAEIHINYLGELPEWAVMSNGIYNLGFCAMRKTTSSNKLVDWWCTRLTNYCFADRVKGSFTDQKWMDWVPGLLGDEVVVSRNLGFNMAPWNFFERRIVKKDGEYFVSCRTDDNQKLDKLIFVHFAGYDYSAFKKGEIKRKRIEELHEYEDLLGIQSDYRDAFVTNKEIFDSFIGQPYSYCTFDNGDEISFFHRRIYNGLIEDGQNIPNPYDVGKGTFYSKLKRAGMVYPKSDIDSLNARNIPNIIRKRKQISHLFKIIYFFLGYKKYSLFVRGIIDYHRPESHTFLLK